MPHIPPFYLPDSAEPFLLVSHRLSATDIFPDDSYFSDIEDGGGSDDFASHFSAHTASAADHAEVTPIAAAPTAAGHPSAFLLSTHRRRFHLRMAEVGAPTLAPNEPIITVSDGCCAPSADDRSHRGSVLVSAASAHHPQMVDAETTAPAPTEPTTAVSDVEELVLAANRPPVSRWKLLSRPTTPQ